MIYITGDIHHASMKTADQAHMNCSEAEAAIYMADIALKYDICLTFFITGKTVTEETDSIRNLAAYKNIEIGGHNYYAFKPKWLYQGIFYRLFNNPNGPDTWQDYEIAKTLKTFKYHIGIDLLSWRDHAYKCNSSTNSLLSKHGVKFASNIIDPDILQPFFDADNDIINLPVNIWPDHDHIFHGDFTSDQTPPCNLGRSKFRPEFFTIDEWSNSIEKIIIEHQSSNSLSSLLIHPGCMKIADDFACFEKLCSFIKTHNYSTNLVSNINLQKKLS